MTANPGLVRLVASRYGQLQGLFTIAWSVWTLWWGAMMFSSRWLDGADVSDWIAVPLSLPLLVFMVMQVCWLHPRLKGYYSSRFGRVRSQQSLSTLVYGNWTFQGFMFGSLVADVHARWLILSVGLLCLAAWPAWIVCRDWPYRWHWLPLLVAAIGAAQSMSLMPSYSFAIRHLGGWALAVAAAESFAGLGDHLLLTRTLRGRAADGALTSEQLP